MFPERAPPGLQEDEGEVAARRDALAVHASCSSQLLQAKTSYTRGVWNVNTVQVHMTETKGWWGVGVGAGWLGRLTD